jgi:hypothetical protein
MRAYPYDISIYPDNSPREFKSACEKIEQAFPEFRKERLLVDVDGSTIQAYTREDQEIVVYDCYDVGAVFALSDVDIGPALA